MSGYISPVLEGIDSRFVDFEFRKEADDLGIETFGYIEPTQSELMAFREMPNVKRYAAARPVYTRAQVIEHIKRMDAEGGWRYRRIVHKKNQKSEPSCVYNATAHAFQNKWNVQFGDHNAISMSPMSGYRWNGTRTSGSSVGGAIKWLSEVGLLPTDNPENRARFKQVHPDVGYSEPFMQNWKTETAPMFRADEWYWVESVEEWWSSVINGDDCVGGRDSHCIDHCGLGLDGNSILSFYVQSWSVPWGFKLETSIGPLTTFGADSESKVRTMTSRDGWALGSVLRPTFMRGVS